MRRLLAVTWTFALCLGLTPARSDQEVGNESGPATSPDAEQGRLGAPLRVHDGPAAGRLDVGGVDRPSGSRAGTGAIAAVAPRDENFPVTSTARPIRLFEGVISNPARDLTAGIAGQTDGDLLVLIWEDRERVVVHTSSDAGDTFAPETVLAFSGEVLGASADLVTGSDTVVVTAGVTDPNGSAGLEAACTTDFGATWSVTTLVQDGDATHGTRESSTAVSGSTVGIVYREDPGGDLFLITSTDGCASFQGPVRVNLNAPEGEGFPGDFSLDVELDGTAHVAYEDQPDVYYVKCEDPGGGLACGTPEALIPPIVPAHEFSANPWVAVNCSGNPSVAFSDDEGLDHTYVVQRDDVAGTWSVRRDLAGNDDNFLTLPLISVFDPACVSGDADFVLTFVDSTDDLLYSRSTDGGDSYGSVYNVASGLGGHPTYQLPFAPVTKDGSGRCLALWTDNTADTYAGTHTDVYARQGDCADLSGFVKEQIDGAPGAGAWHSIAAAVPCGPDRICAIWNDDRNAGGKSGDTFFNRRETTPGSESWGTARRIDQDGSPVLPITYSGGPRMVARGSTSVAVSASQAAAGEHLNVFWTRSTDGGYTWSAPAAVTTNGGDEIERYPVVLCEGDCTTFHVALSRVDSDTFLTPNLEVASTRDGGGTFDAPTGFGYVVLDEFDLLELPGTGTGMAWSDETNILFRKTADGGLSWSGSVVVDQNASSFNRNPDCCTTDGTHIGCLIAAPDVQFFFYTSKVVFSDDGGATWGDEQQLLADSPDGGSFNHYATCFAGPNGNPWMAAMIEDDRSSDSWSSVKVEFIDLVTHTQKGEFPLGPADDPEWNGSMDCADCNPDNTCDRPCFMTYARQDFTDGHGIHACRVDPVTSASLGCENLTLDSAAGIGTPVPSAFSWDPVIVRSNRTGQSPEHCVAWRDASAGDNELVRRCSTDGMITFGDTTRWTTGSPQGTEFVGYDFSAGGECAALDDAALCAIAVSNASVFFEWQLLPMSRADADFDTVGSDSDCDDSDPDLQALPGETRDLRVDKCGVDCLDLSWTAPTSDGCTCTVTYEALSATLSDVRAGTFNNFACLSDDLASPAWTDTRTDPAPGEGFAYLSRAQHACGFGTAGDSTLMVDPRDDLDAHDACGP